MAQQITDEDIATINEVRLWVGIVSLNLLETSQKLDSTEIFEDIENSILCLSGHLAVLKELHEKFDKSQL